LPQTGTDVSPPLSSVRLGGHSGRIGSLSFSKDGKRLLSASQDRTLRLWDLDKATEIKQFKHQGNHPFNKAVMSPDGKFAIAHASGRYYGYLVFDLTTGNSNGYGIYENENHFHYSVDLDVKEGRFALASDSTGEIGLIGTNGWHVQRFFKGHKGLVHWLQFSEDSERILSSGDDKTIRLWDAKKDKENELCKIPGSGEMSPPIAFSPDARFVALSNKEHGIQLWDVSDSKNPKKLDGFKGHKDHVLCLAFSPDSRQLLSGGRDKIVRLWDVASRAELKRLEGHGDDVTCVAFSPAGSPLASSANDRTIRLWK
jgi:WD40 repeat protein